MTPRAGLCETCVFARVVESGRGSRFYLCKRWETDGRFPKYPALPVLACIGYERGPKDQGSGPEPDANVTES